MRVLLVDPAPRSGIVEPYEHLGLGYLCAAVREKGHETKIVSMPIHNLSVRRAVKRIREYDPDLLGFSVKEVNARRTLLMIKILRHVGLCSHITLGGHFPTFNHRRILQDFPEVDSIVRGDGEDTLIQLMEALANRNPLSAVRGLTFREWHRIKVNPPRPLIEDLDRLPFPSRNFTEEVIQRGGAIAISASRGCYANCSFCSIRSFYGTSPGRKWRARSPKNVGDEMESLASRFPNAQFNFVDDQFVGPGEKGRKYALDIASEILRKDMSIRFILSSRADAIEEDLFVHLKRAGLRKVFLGVESGTQRGLDRFQKKTTVEQNKRALRVLSKIGLDYTIAFIIFDPYSTLDDVRGNLEFLSEIRPFWWGKKGVLSIEPSIIVHRGTPIEQALRKEGRLKGNYMGSTYTIEDRRIEAIRRCADMSLRRIIPAVHEMKEKKKETERKVKRIMSSIAFPLKTLIKSSRPVAGCPH